MFRYFKKIHDTDYVLKWKSKGLSDESIKSASAPNTILDPSLGYLGTKIRIKLDGSCLKQGKTTFNHKKSIVNLYIAYEINKVFII